MRGQEIYEGGERFALNKGWCLMHKYCKKSIDLHLDNHQYQGLSICQAPPISHLPCLPAYANSQRESFVSFVGGRSIFPWQSLIRQWTLTWALQTSQKQMSFFFLIFSTTEGVMLTAEATCFHRNIGAGRGEVSLSLLVQGSTWLTLKREHWLQIYQKYYF